MLDPDDILDTALLKNVVGIREAIEELTDKHDATCDRLAAAWEEQLELNRMVTAMLKRLVERDNHAFIVANAQAKGRNPAN